ncbi:uncharacterized protein LOC112595742 [Melanaphis sacchari]|uniref:uncharacterized protein LOC112595742 n=1 Tax=Melanaphis sacchari TaxID=742174 RepID=UPI000DC1398F|nr:uncharacterized protein LOC112595742 [Melanaphis sacchari]
MEIWTKDTTQQSTDEDTINEETNQIPLKNDTEPIIKTDLEKRVEDVKVILDNIQTQNKQDSSLNCHSTTDIKIHEEINHCKIAEVLRVIPIIEKNLQTLTDKVSCLSDLFDMKNLNAKIVTDHNAIPNNTNTITALKSVDESNSMKDTTTQKKKKTTLGKISKKSKKTPNNKQKVINKKNKTDKKEDKSEINPIEIINQNNQVTNTENLPQSVKTDNQLPNLDGRLECLFTKIQSALSQFKIDQENEKSKIMVHLTGLENKMNRNEVNIDKLICNVKQLGKNNEYAVMTSKPSNVEKETKQELQKSINDIKMCIDYLIQPDIPLTQQCITTDAPNINTNVNSACNSNRCVCKLIDNTNSDTLQVINSHHDNNKIKYGDIILSEFLKAKLTLEMIKRSEHSEHQQIVHANTFSNQIDDKKNSNLSVCLKKTSHPKDDCVQKLNVEQNINQLTLCPKQSVHHFFKNDTKSNQPISKKSSCEKNQICDFLSSQPIPEWIRRNQNLVTSDNSCGTDAKCPQTNCNSYANKFYNIERIVKESCSNNNTDGIVYEITQKQNIPEDNKDHTFKEHNLVPCNSLNKNPWTV